MWGGERGSMLESSIGSKAWNHGAWKAWKYTPRGMVGREAWEAWNMEPCSTGHGAHGKSYSHDSSTYILTLGVGDHPSWGV